MKTLALITGEKIISSKISNLILEKHPYSKKIIKNDENELFLGKFPKEFYIIFDDACSLNEDPFFSSFSTQELQKVPNKNASVNTLYYRDSDVAKSVIKIIAEAYPDLVVFDEQDDCFKTVLEYVN